MADEDLHPLLTQCPNCETRFKVNEAQLRVAQGKVRCGACLAVFDATEHLLLDGDEVVSQGGEDVDALLLEIDAEAERVLASPEEEPVDLQVEDAEPPLEPEQQLPDELAALEAELLSELKSGEQSAASDLLSQLDPVSESKESPEQISADIALPEAVPRNPEPQPVVAEPAQVVVGEAAPAAVASAASPPLAETAPVIPAELLYDDEEPESKRSWLGTAILVLALVGLPAQVMWYKFEEWSKIDGLRPFYARICELAGCELPVRRDVGMISARNSVLRDHPQVGQALVYDTLLVNQAHYEQPFPLVELTLLTIRGQMVATRRFKPQEYLAGEVSPTSFMAPLTPIHISLAIEDPGVKPLNFEVRFFPHD